MEKGPSVSEGAKRFLKEKVLKSNEESELEKMLAEKMSTLESNLYSKIKSEEIRNSRLKLLIERIIDLRKNLIILIKTKEDNLPNKLKIILQRELIELSELTDIVKDDEKTKHLLYRAEEDDKSYENLDPFEGHHDEITIISNRVSRLEQYISKMDKAIVDKLNDEKILSDFDFISAKKTEIGQIDKEQMLEIMKENRQKRMPEEVLHRGLRKFERSFNGEGKSYILKDKEGRIITFISLIFEPGNKIYVSDFSFRENDKDPLVAYAFLRKTLKRFASNYDVIAKVNAKNIALLNMYKNRFGFEINNEIPNYDNSGDLYYEIILKTKSNLGFRTS